MAIAWGPTINDRWAVGIELVVTSTTDSSVTVRADYYFWARYNISDSSNTLSASGSWGSTTASKSLSTPASGPTTVLIASQSATFSRPYGGTSTVSQSISYSGLEAVGTTLRASASYTVPRRSYTAPASPAITNTSHSGSTGEIKWSNAHSTSTSSSGYASGLVANWYYMGDGGAAIHLGTHYPSNTATIDSYVVPSGRAFTVGLYARNQDAVSPEVWTGWVYPTPAAPTGISNVRKSDTQNIISWTPKALNLPDTTIVLERSVNSGPWAHLKSLSATASSYTDNTTAAGSSYRYRVLTQYGNRYSGWTTSGTTYNTPLVPTISGVMRNSDTQYTIGIVTNAPNRAGTSTIVERSTNDGTWTQIASLSPTTTSYVDRGTVTNSFYRYRVKTTYGTTSSAYSVSGYYYNSPAAPSNAHASKNADNSVRVTWSDTARTETGYAVQRSQDGGISWVTLTTDIPANATSYLDSSAPGGSLTYRVQALRGSIPSGWSTPSPSITTIAPPRAPTLQEYPKVTISTGDGTFLLKWLHNPVDGSEQSSAEVAVLAPGSAEVVTPISGSQNTFTVTGISAGTYRLSVRTKGAHADFSPWASHVYITVSDPPSLAITAPATDGTVADTVPFLTSWEFSGGALTTLNYSISDSSGRMVFARSNPAGSSITLDASTWIPSNGESYTIRIDARASNGLTAIAERTFLVAYVPPVEPIVEVTVDHTTLSAQISITDGLPVDGLATPESYTLIRVTPLDEVVLADGLMSSSSINDSLPPLNIPYHYKIVSHAASGAVAETLFEATIDAPSTFAINFGDGLLEMLTAKYNMKLNTDGMKEQKLQAYEGRRYPVLYHGRRRERKINMLATIVPGEERLWDALDDYAGVCILRTMDGLRIPVMENHTISQSYNAPPSIDIKMERVDHELG